MDTGETPVRDILNESGVDTGDQSQLPEALSPGAGTAPQDGKKLVFGKYPDLSAAEKAHKSLTAQFTQRSQKLKALEALLGRPDIQKAASSDPQLKAALTQVGYELGAEEEAEEKEQAQAQGDDWDGNEDDPRFQLQVLRQEIALKEQKSELEQELKRRMTPDEWNQVRDVMRTVGGRLPVPQAWRLTPAYDQMVKANTAKEIAAARGPVRTGQRPPPILLPGGEKADITKRPSKMNSNEKSELIRGILRGDVK